MSSDNVQEWRSSSHVVPTYKWPPKNNTAFHNVAPFRNNKAAFISPQNPSIKKKNCWNIQYTTVMRLWPTTVMRVAVLAHAPPSLCAGHVWQFINNNNTNQSPDRPWSTTKCPRDSRWSLHCHRRDWIVDQSHHPLVCCCPQGSARMRQEAHPVRAALRWRRFRHTLRGRIKGGGGGYREGGHNIPDWREVACDVLVVHRGLDLVIMSCSCVK